MKHLLPIIFIILTGSSYAQQIPFDRNDFNPDLLNTYILDELNHSRKQAKCVPFNLNADLKPAADDQCAYNEANGIITNRQKQNRDKKLAKNRVDFYGGNFKYAVEFIASTKIETNKKNSYQSIAKGLVASIMKSRSSYKLITSEEFENIYGAFTFSSSNKVICNLVMASREYDKTYPEQSDTCYYKNYIQRQGKILIKKMNPGYVSLGPDSCIYYTNPTSLFSKLFLQNRWRSGMAADIVLKSQYPCDSTNFFSPEFAVRGIGLAPVYKKDFERFGIFGCTVNLGKMPAYIQEDFAINLTIINTKRTWLSVGYDFIPASYYFKPELKFEFDSLSLETRKQFVDKNETTIAFDKGSVQPNDSSFIHFTEAIKTNNKIVRIQLEGFASIEGNLESNTRLFKNRAQILINELRKTGVDTSIIHYTLSENYAAFRKDIRYTKYFWLDTLPDEKIREYVNLHQNEFEFLLKYHRYVHCTIETQKDTVKYYTREQWIEETNLAIEKESKSRMNKSLEYAYSLYLNGQITVEDIQAVAIPIGKKTTSAAENQAILVYLCSDKSDNSLVQLINSLKKLDPKYSHTLATSLALAEYLHFLNSPDHSRKFFKRIEKDNKIAAKTKARILLHVATIHDFNIPRFFSKRFFFYPKVKRFVNPARLNVDESFQLSTYYYYFDQERFAYNLVKAKAAKTEDPEQIIYFLKILEYSKFNIPHGEKIAHYKKLAKKRPELFCASFNYYGINLQVFDDPDIKKIYCKTCSE